MTGRDDSELDRAVDAHRGAAPAQLALLEEEAAIAEAKRGKGRPAGSRNLRSEAYAALLTAKHGDPLDIATKIAAIDVLDEENVQQLARKWGCSRFEAVKLWATINRDVQGYLHQQMPRAIVLPPGAPGGDRVLIEIDGEYHELASADDGAAQ